MNIAYMIEAHTDAEQLVRLCSALQLSGDIFIHVDKKTKSIDFWNTINDYVKNNHGIKILGKRHFVAWGGYSQVECFRSLLAEVLRGEKKYDRILLLSGLDYPIFSPSQINSFFEENKTKEYVCGYNISECGYDFQLRKIKYYHFFRDIPLPHKSIVRRTIIGGSMLLLKYLGIRRKPYLMMGGKRWDVYFGSSWIGITKECGEYILRQLETNKELTKFFSSTYAPDEMCVPTIVMNSPFAINAINVTEMSFKAVTPLHYLNYEECIWSYDENDYDTLIASRKMFVRKTISGKSEKLICMINKSWSR